jgi:hypothetical protein
MSEQAIEGVLSSLVKELRKDPQNKELLQAVKELTDQVKILNGSEEVPPEQAALERAYPALRGKRQGRSHLESPPG